MGGREVALNISRSLETIIIESFRFPKSLCSSLLEVLFYFVFVQIGVGNRPSDPPLEPYTRLFLGSLTSVHCPMGSKMQNKLNAVFCVWGWHRPQQHCHSETYTNPFLVGWVIPNIGNSTCQYVWILLAICCFVHLLQLSREKSHQILYLTISCILRAKS